MAASLQTWKTEGLPRGEMPIFAMMDVTTCEMANSTHLLWDVDPGASSSYSLAADCIAAVSTLLNDTVAAVKSFDLNPSSASLSPTWRPCLETVAPFGCGVNPVGSMQFLSGFPSVGNSVTLGIHNPLGSQARGSATFMYFSTGSDAAFPCGTSANGFGMGKDGIGETLIDTNAIFSIVQGDNWNGTPVPYVVSIPNDPSVIGVQLFLQGLIVDSSRGATNEFGVTDAAELVIGP